MHSRFVQESYAENVNRFAFAKIIVAIFATKQRPCR